MRPADESRGDAGDLTAIFASFPDEWEAGLVRDALLAAGLPATIAGGFTASFRADAPGRVRVLVRERDLAAAAEAVRRAREEAAAIDWDAVDLQGDPGGDGDDR
jgi:hypothetical protein